MLPDAWAKRLVDLNVRKLRDDDLAWADCVWLSAMAVQRESARAIVARRKAAGLPVMAGGPLFSCEPDQFPEVDHLVRNEAEVTLPALIEWRRLKPGIGFNTEASIDPPDDLRASLP